MRLPIPPPGLGVGFTAANAGWWGWQGFYRDWVDMSIIRGKFQRADGRGQRTEKATAKTINRRRTRTDADRVNGLRPEAELSGRYADWEVFYRAPCTRPKGIGLWPKTARRQRTA